MTQTQYVIDVQDTSWLQILDILLIDHRKSEKDLYDHLSVSIRSPDSIVYSIDKDWLPAEKLAKIFGVSVEAVEQTEVITLRPLNGSTGWQEPTVQYYGRA